MLDIAAGRDAGGQTQVRDRPRRSVGRDRAEPPEHARELSHPAPLRPRALGEGIEPSLIVDFPTLLGLLEGVGLSEDPSISKLVPYLRSATTLAGGGRQLGGELERFRLVLGLQRTAG